jgi:hypothetical protein
MIEELLKEHLQYDPDNGKLLWLKPYDRYSRVKAGDIAGTTWNNYVRVKFLGKSYSAHRLAWFLYYNAWPKLHLDHINGDSTDNRIVNLRECTHQQNHGNRKKQANLSGFKGVSKKDNKWQARVCFNFKRHYLGLFNTAEEAAKAYDEKAKELHGEFARLNF